ncbi:Rsm22-domain-containing protein [Rhizodiscina lignyota]|uniref:Rsm22-domain-containing protein n=1 Tax=Rhizodiscina lignyota TaxID=1504668 RepID=A0A9P4IUZ0_9PEZI|nr:Rsm22-domain-containing protein [Rhizodiscina lignyota]
MNSICILCRLKLISSAGSIRASQRSIQALVPQTRSAALRIPRHARSFASRSARLSKSRVTAPPEDTSGADIQQSDQQPDTLPHQTEATARRARRKFGDALPEGLLNNEELGAYEKLYGPPERIVLETESAGQEPNAQQVQVEGRTTLHVEGLDSTFEEVETIFETRRNGVEDTRAAKVAGLLDEFDLSEAEKSLLAEYAEVEERFENGHQLTAEDETVLRNREAQELMRTVQGYEEDMDGEDDIEYDPARPRDEDEDDADIWPGDEERLRTHPYTKLGRFCTSPTTIQFPKATFLEPVKQAIAPATTRQMRNHAESIFDGPGLPYSPSTPRRSRTMEQRPIPLQAGQRSMSDMDSYVYCATVMPGVYASALSVLTEIRKRLGSRWLRDMMAQDGGPVVLDAGAGGAGVLAWRDIVKAEWEAMQEEDAPEPTLESPTGVSTSKQGQAGKATVLTASDALRHRVSTLLDNTTFLPRLPEAVHLDGAEKRKRYDIIIATHTLWPIDKDYMRKTQVDTLWSLLKPSGGVLVLIEKGVPRGFEVIAGAREHLLKRHIADPLESVDKNVMDERRIPKEEGMIIAPCTNHTKCPMYPVPGVSRARKDWCHFSQRFIRPPFLQHILGARQINHDDVEFSYLAVSRGTDLRDFLPVEQGPEATNRAYNGFEHHSITLNSPATASGLPADTLQTSALHHSLTLPRLILPPLKRPKHVILDVCTPSGTLERWTVTKSFSRQAYRDARKSAWGDLWALGAKSRAWKRVNLGKKVSGIITGDDKKSGKSIDIERYYGITSVAELAENSRESMQRDAVEKEKEKPKWMKKIERRKEIRRTRKMMDI